MLKILCPKIRVFKKLFSSASASKQNMCSFDRQELICHEGNSTISTFLDQTTHVKYRDRYFEKSKDSLFDRHKTDITSVAVYRNYINIK